MTPVPTPRTDALAGMPDGWDAAASEIWNLARQLERELTQAAERIAELVRARDESTRLITAERERMDALVEKQAERIRVMTEALELVLIFYKPGPWTAEMKRWKEIAGDIPPHTAGLCDFIRAALSDIGAKPCNYSKDSHERFECDAGIKCECERAKGKP